MEIGQDGLMFSIDSLIALTIVIVLAGAIVQQELSLEEKGTTFEAMHDKAFDRAVLGMYSETGSVETISAGSELGKCIRVYYLDPDNDLGTRAVPSPQSFCEET